MTYRPRLLSALGDTTGIDPSSRADLHQEPECLDPQDPLTNYCTGRLRGFVRIFTRAGFPLSNQDLTLPPEQRPTGPVPTLQEWAAFDAEASRRGVAGYINSVKKNAIPDSGFLASFSRAVTTIGHSLAKGDIFSALKGGQVALTTVTSQLDKFVPGSGAVLSDILTGALMPILPFAPALTGTLATISGNAPLIGPVAGPLVQAAGTGSQKFIEGVRTVGTTGVETAFNVATQQQINNALLQSLSDFAVKGATDLGPLKETLLKLDATYRQTHGDLLAKLQATAREAWNEFQFALTLAAIIASAGSVVGLEVAAAPGALADGSVVPGSLADTLQTGKAIASVAMQAADTTLQVSDAYQAAQKIRAATDAAKKAALAHVAELDLEAKALEDQIAAIQDQIARVRGARSALGAKGAAATNDNTLLLLAGAAIFFEVLS